jgi:hypothetical protein
MQEGEKLWHTPSKYQRYPVLLHIQQNFPLLSNDATKKETTVAEPQKFHTSYTKCQMILM